MEKEGYIERIIYQNAENGYTVAAVETDDDEEIFVGYLHGVEQGMYIVAQGEEVDHPQYDVQFKVISFSLKLPDDLDGMRMYLGSGMIKGVGEILAAKIVKKFKMDTFRIIEEEPERLSEIKGISERKAREIAIQFLEKKELRDAILFLSKFGMSASLSVKVYNEYGSRMYEILKTNPYQMAEDITSIGFKTADAIAMRAGIGIDSDFRIRAAILYTISQSMGLGHMYLPKHMLVSKTRELLSYNGEAGGFEIDLVTMDDFSAMPLITESAIENQLMTLLIDGKIVIKTIEDEEVIYSNMNYNMELRSARMLLDLDIEYPEDEEDIRDQLIAIETAEGITLDEKQEEAVIKAATHGITIITGGPGTGKTTTINTIIKYFERQEMEIFLAAPTGRAAKRICEATGYDAQTLHRLLELSGGSMEDGKSARFERNASNPLEADVIIVDEMSMVDTFMIHALLNATAPGTRLILVGDVDQLPSVGAGDVLRDLIHSNAFSVVFLSKIYRQSEQSDIVLNAHKINRGEQFTIDNKSKDFFFMRRENIKAVIDEMCVLVKDNLPGYVGVPPMDIQVLTPMRKGDLGIENLNPILQNLLNPPSKKKLEKEVHGTIFREGDKVMQIKNNYKLEWTIFSSKGHFEGGHGVGVFNGDMGRIASINDYAEEITVEFDDNRLVSYPYSMLDELVLSYAITVHKSQGSEYPAVVLPLLGGPRVLMNRNLLYTAVTRAKNLVVLVGSPNTIGNMIQNEHTGKRYTSLDIRIHELKEMLA